MSEGYTPLPRRKTFGIQPRRRATAGNVYTAEAGCLTSYAIAHLPFALDMSERRMDSWISQSVPLLDPVFHKISLHRNAHLMRFGNSSMSTSIFSNPLSLASFAPILASQANSGYIGLPRFRTRSWLFHFFLVFRAFYATAISSLCPATVRSASHIRPLYYLIPIWTSLCDFYFSLFFPSSRSKWVTVVQIFKFLDGKLISTPRRAFILNSSSPHCYSS